MSEPLSGAVTGALNALATPIAKLVETCSAGLGRVYEPVHLKRMANAEAERMLVLARASNEVTDIQRRAAERWIAVEERRQVNIETIVQKAEAELPTAVSETAVDPGWSAKFFDECKDVSSETMQQLWGRLLAGEVARPGAYSLRTMRVLSALSAAEAHAFSQLCSLTFSVQISTPLMLEERESFFQELGLAYSMQKQLEAAGLMHREALGLRIPKFSGPLRLFPLDQGKALMGLRHMPDVPVDIEIGQVRLTSEGREIAGLWKGLLNESHAAWLVDHFRTKGWRMELVDVEHKDHGYIYQNPSFIDEYLFPRQSTSSPGQIDPLRP